MAAMVAFLLRYQFALVKLSDGPENAEMPGEFFSTLHRWHMWGAIAIVLPVVSLVLMVNKPELW